MYNRLYKYLLQNNLFYEKQFGFQASNSTEHAVIQLISQILDAFNESKYTLGIFIDLSKAFDTVDHNILLKKLDMYGIKGKNLKWFHSYLTNRKQFIKCRDQNTDLDVLRCGVPQGSILVPLLFQQTTHLAKYIGYCLLLLLPSYYHKCTFFHVTYKFTEIFNISITY